MDKEQFEILFREHFKALTGFAKKYVNDIDIAKGIVHDVFMKLWEKRTDIDTRQSVKSYLYTGVYNRSLNYIRDHKKFDKSAEQSEIPEQKQNWDISNEMEAIEIQAKIDRTLAELPEKCRQIFEMSRYEELKYREIAEKLNISVKTVETQMTKALKALRKNLSEYIHLLVWLYLIADIFINL